MRWLPKIAVFDCSTTDPFDDNIPDYSGRVLILNWLGVTVELSVSREAS